MKNNLTDKQKEALKKAIEVKNKAVKGSKTITK